MLRPEIDFLIEADRSGCVVVEKASGVLWTAEELTAARDGGSYQETSGLRPADDLLEISGPFPGCCQSTGAGADLSRYRAVAQTDHFIFFAGPR
jgi:hypothetical protein